MILVVRACLTLQAAWMPYIPAAFAANMWTRECTSDTLDSFTEKRGGQGDLSLAMAALAVASPAHVW